MQCTALSQPQLVSPVGRLEMFVFSPLFRPRSINSSVDLSYCKCMP